MKNDSYGDNFKKFFGFSAVSYQDRENARWWKFASLIAICLTFIVIAVLVF